MSKVRGSSGEEIPSVRGQGQGPEELLHVYFYYNKCLDDAFINASIFKNVSFFYEGTTCVTIYQIHIHMLIYA